MIGLSTRAIFLCWYCTVKTDSSTAFSEIWRAIFTARQIWLPSNATLIQIYLLILIQVKKRVTVGRCCTSQQNERLFIALILSSSFVDIEKLIIYCT